MKPNLSRLSVDGAPPGAKRQLWTLTLMAADAVHESSLPGVSPQPGGPRAGC